MANLFGELAYNAVHKISAEHGFKEGSAEKNALHALIGGIMSQLTSGNFLAGASGAMINEMIQQKLAESFKDDPAMHQWASALVGTVVSQIVSGKGQAGASAAVSGTKNNNMHNIGFIKNSILNADSNSLKDGKVYIVQGSIDVMGGSVTGGSILLENEDVFDFIAIGKGDSLLELERAEFTGEVYQPVLDNNGKMIFGENMLPVLKKITDSDELKNALVGPSISSEVAAYWGVGGSYLGNGRILIMKGNKTNAGIGFAVSVSGYMGKRNEIYK